MNYTPGAAATWFVVFQSPLLHALYITTPDLAAGTVGTPYIAAPQPLQADLGISPYTFAVIAGNLPLGVTLASDGTFSGTPTLAATYTFTVRVTDSLGTTGDKTFDIIIIAVRLHGIIELQTESGGWAVLEDVRQGISFRRGMSGIQPKDNFADVGTMYFALNNNENIRLGRGAYSPDHVQRLAGFILGGKVRYRIGDRVLFTGTLSSISPDTGLYGARTTRCTALDWMWQASRKRLADIPVVVDSTDAQAFQTLVNAMPVKQQPTAVSIDASTDVLPVVFDLVRDSKTRWRDEAYRIASSTLAKVWVKGDDTLVYESRTRRPRLTSDADSFTDHNGFTVQHDAESIINSISVVAHPRQVSDTAVIVFDLGVPILLEQNSPLVVFGRWVDSANPETKIGGVRPIVPVAGVDYLLNSSQNGLGVDLTAFADFSYTVSGNSTTFTISYTPQVPFSSDVWLVRLRQRAFPIFVYQSLPAILEDSDSIDEHGEYSDDYDLYYQSDVPFARALADYIIKTNKDPRSSLGEFTRFVGLDNDNPNVYRSIDRDIGDRIYINDPQTGVNGSFYICSVGLEEGDRTLQTTWLLAPVDIPNRTWILGHATRSRLSDTAILASGLFT